MARAKIEQWPVRELHTTHTTRQGHRHRHRHRRRHTLRSPQLPREVGRREPDGVRWGGPTQPAPALQRLVLSRRRRSLSKSVALLPVPGARSASLVARASPEGGRGGAEAMRMSSSGWSCREGGGRGMDAPQIRASREDRPLSGGRVLPRRPLGHLERPRSPRREALLSGECITASLAGSADDCRKFG